MRILILGPQGSGKGTQARRIAALHDVPHVATGDILRAAIAEGSELGQRVEPILERGDLVPDDLMVELIRERLVDEQGFVLDGFPRTVPQAEALDAMLEEIGKPLDVVLLLQVSDDVALQRLLERGAEEGRLDDAPDVILNRLRLYHGLTEPVVDRYRSDGMLQAVDGEQTVDEVFVAVEDALERALERARAQGPDPVEPDPAEVRSP
jgi:adenylate kinase